MGRVKNTRDDAHSLISILHSDTLSLAKAERKTEENFLLHNFPRRKKINENSFASFFAVPMMHEREEVNESSLARMISTVDDIERKKNNEVSFFSLSLIFAVTLE